MLYAVDITITAGKTVLVDACSKAEAASKARWKESKRRQLLEEGDFVVLCGTHCVREVKESRK
jgi:hypothetical protein